MTMSLLSVSLFLLARAVMRASQARALIQAQDIFFLLLNENACKGYFCHKKICENSPEKNCMFISVLIITCQPMIFHESCQMFPMVFE